MSFISLDSIVDSMTIVLLHITPTLAAGESDIYPIYL